MRKIGRFRGSFNFLSNFHAAPFYWKEKFWPTIEHAFQASKTDDVQAKEAIRNAPSPSEAKRLGRSVLLIPNWEGAKVDIMRRLLYEKFTQRPSLKHRLLATRSSSLVEGELLA